MEPYQTKNPLSANETTQRMKIDLPNKRKYLQVIQLTDDYYAKYKNSKILMTEIPKYNNLKMDEWSEQTVLKKLEIVNKHRGKRLNITISQGNLN